MSAPRLLMLTGARGAGKTTFCRSLAAYARLQSWEVAGLLSPAVFKDGIKTGILVEDAHSSESRLLASSKPNPTLDLRLGDWYFDRSSLDWGNRVLERSLPCDLLIVDELGPLELVQHTGWQAAINILHRSDFRVGLVVIRPELLELANDLFPFTETLQIDQSKSIEQWVEFIWPKISV